MHRSLVAVALSLFTLPTPAQVELAHNVVFPENAIIFPMPEGAALGMLIEPRDLKDRVLLAFKNPDAHNLADASLGIHMVATLDERACTETASLNIGKRGIPPTTGWLDLRAGLAWLGPLPTKLEFDPHTARPLGDIPRAITDYELFFRNLTCTTFEQRDPPALMLLILSVDSIR